MPARDAASRTISHSTFGGIPLPQIRPVLLIDQKSTPSVMPLASFHASIPSVTTLEWERYGRVRRVEVRSRSAWRGTRSSFCHGTNRGPHSQKPHTLLRAEPVSRHEHPSGALL